ncbi:MAG: PD-(D/E)XK nuclease family protein [Methylophilaceae bacterium]|nr:PD-(D/E)XK nuclease family protein [Methylophilaceae bacterium]
MSEAPLILCSTARLAWMTRQAYDLAQRAAGHARWQPPTVLTLAQWLDDTVERALLTGEVEMDALPVRPLDEAAELLLWEQAIAQCLTDDAALPLFDIAGIVRIAAEANALVEGWGVSVSAHELTEETRQFMRWREAFRALCDHHRVMEAARLRKLQIDILQRGIKTLPGKIHLAGFDRLGPQEQRLIEVLRDRGVRVSLLEPERRPQAQSWQLACEDAEAECRAAVAWVRAKLEACPTAMLAIMVPDLDVRRSCLSALLDDVLHPETVFPARSEGRRHYDISLGEPLAAHPLVACALELIGLAVQRPQFSQQAFGCLLRDVYWSSGVREADARALLEARMRRKLPPAVRLEQVVRLAEIALRDGLPIACLSAHLQALHAEAGNWPRRQGAAAWAKAFATLLAAAGWPGERSLSSHEFQAHRAWTETLEAFARLNDLLGTLDAMTAWKRLGRLCRTRIFQPEADGTAQILVMGMLETAAVPLDAVWVMGMNDHLWPPPPCPNPLLSAAAQRAARAPGADARIQAEFAQVIQHRIFSSAPEVVLSWARKEGERELRPSPLLEDVPSWPHPPAYASTLAERLAQPAAMQWLDDHRAPPVAADEQVRGGTGLLRAQAVCPAWAYFRYRLGARPLDQPVEGLDALQRGSLLHAVLQCFWRGRDSAWLQGMGQDALADAIDRAVEQGLHRFCETLEVSLPPVFLTLERQRLQALLTVWLEYERTRPPFVVQDCERQVTLDIAGLRVSLTLDRIDRLEDGRWVVLDYKTGSKPDFRSWAEDRIADPQLPVYAALAMADEEVAAVCYAKVRADAQQFIGIAATDGILPGVKALEGARSVFPETRFPSWQALLAHWRERLEAIAMEILAGEAAVKFRDEADLRHCEVLPLLRLPERKLQYERGGWYRA